MIAIVKYWPEHDPNDVNTVEVDVSSEFTVEDYLSDNSDSLNLALSVVGELGYEMSVSLSDDEEEEDDLPQGPGFNPQIWPPLPGKQPRGYEEGYDDYDEEIMETDRKYKSGFKRSLRCKEHYGEPDLTAYFAQWPDMEEFAQIAMCRTFANYLAQKMRARQPRQEKKIKYGK